MAGSKLFAKVFGSRHYRLKNYIVWNCAVLSGGRIQMLPSQQTGLRHHRPASETPFKWRFADGPIVARCL